MIDGRQATIGAVLPEDFQPQLIAQAFGRCAPANDGCGRLSDDDAASRRRKVFTPTTQVRLFQAFGELKPGVSRRAGARRDRRHSWPASSVSIPTPFGTSVAVVRPMRDQHRRAVTSRSWRAALGVDASCCSSRAPTLRTCCCRERPSEEGDCPSHVGRAAGRCASSANCWRKASDTRCSAAIGGVLFASWLIDAVVMDDRHRRPEACRDDTRCRRDGGGDGDFDWHSALCSASGRPSRSVFTNVQEVLKEGGRSVSASRRVAFYRTGDGCRCRSP